MDLGIPSDITFYKLLTDWGGLIGAVAALIAAIIAYIAICAQIKEAREENREHRQVALQNRARDELLAASVRHAALEVFSLISITFLIHSILVRVMRSLITNRFSGNKLSGFDNGCGHYLRACFALPRSAGARGGEGISNYCIQSATVRERTRVRLPMASCASFLKHWLSGLRPFQKAVNTHGESVPSTADRLAIFPPPLFATPRLVEQLGPARPEMRFLPKDPG